jgi:hypothetical protein
MTPHQLFRETATRPHRPWPPYAWAIVAGAAAAMFVAVVLVAWQASRVLRTRDQVVHRSGGTSESGAEIRERLENECAIVDRMRTTGTGIYAPDFQGVSR